MSVLLEPDRRSYPGGGGATRPALAWRLPADTIAIASAVLGGGLGPRDWIVNVQVALDYGNDDDPAADVAVIAKGLGLDAGRGVGLLTAVPVLDVKVGVDAGVECAATVGVSTPTWAAAPDGAWSRWTPGTINLVCWVPAPLADPALVNAVVTATEAKTQALCEAGVPGSGTASDAIVVCCPMGGVEPYGGPRSRWGARLARAVHDAVASGAASALGPER